MNSFFRSTSPSVPETLSIPETAASRLVRTIIIISIISLSIVPSLVFGSVSDDHLTGGMLELKTVSGESLNDAPIVDTKVTMNIAGLTARVKVVQTFKNESPDWVEGVYLFPLPEKSAVDHLAMKIGERIIVGEIKEKQEPTYTTRLFNVISWHVETNAEESRVSKEYDSRRDE